MFPVPNVRLVEVRVVEVPKLAGGWIAEIPNYKIVIRVEDLLTTRYTGAFSWPCFFVILVRHCEHCKPERVCIHTGRVTRAVGKCIERVFLFETT